MASSTEDRGAPERIVAGAELIADSGAAAAGSEFFRSAEFYEAERVTHSLLIDAGELRIAAPLILREIPGSDLEDAISPYGYPGFEMVRGEGSLDPADIDWSGTGLVSIFIRHRLGAPPVLAGASRRNTVLISDPDLPRKSRMSDRQQIRKNLRAGFELSITPGPETSDAERTAFVAAYTQTMHRTGAAERYFFSDAYFKTLLRSPATWLFLIREPGGEVAAGSLAVRSDEMLHYYLSGTADAFLRGAPMKNILAEMTDFAWQRGLPLNLGGGISAGDALEQFKRGFANREEHLHTSELICDPAAYRQLSGGREADGFFPAYRAAG